MDATNNIATDLFYKVRSRFQGLKLGNETGEITINPEEARFFDFDYMEGQNPIGHVSISLAEPNSMKVYFSSGITESMDTGQKNNWYGFLKELRMFAKRRLMAFDTRDIAKDNLDKRDYAFLSQHNQPQKSQNNSVVTPVGESVMNESALYGSRTMSYQKLMDTRLIIKHSHALTDDTQPGARSRNISALFVENQDGERFKYPFIHLSGARAMQRHVANGGVPYDDIGKSIIQMSEEIAQLKSFSNYVVRNDLMNSGNNGIVERSQQQLANLREQMAKLAKQGHYEAYKESFQAQSPLEVPEEVVEQFTDQFTVRNFKEDIKSVFPVLYRLMKESEIGYNDIVGLTAQESAEEQVVEKADPFSKFESWVMGLGEDSAITSQDPEEQQLALQNLQTLVKENFPAGVDGSNAIESLKGIIEDPQLFKQIKEQAKQDPASDVRGVVAEWLQQNTPEALQGLDFGDFQPEPAPEDPMAYANASADADAEYYGQQESSINEASNDLELDYDTESAVVEFNRGPDGVAQITKVSIGKADITSTFPPDVLADMAGDIQEDDQSPIQDFYTTVELGIDYSISGEYRDATWGYNGGDPAEYPELDDVTVSVIGNGNSVEIDANDLGKDASDWIDEKIWDAAESSRDDYDDYDRYEGAEQEGEEKEKTMNVQELAEFIHSFYDRNTGTFPKGPEGVCTMVGKKFGEQAEHVARKFVERMAPQQQVENFDGDGIVVGGRVQIADDPAWKGKVVMIDPKIAQRVHVQWDQGGNPEPIRRSILKAITTENTDLDRIKHLSGISQGIRM